MTIPTPPELLKLADSIELAVSHTGDAIISGDKWGMIVTALRHSASASTAGRGEVEKAIEAERSYWMNNSVGSIRRDIDASFDRMIAALASPPAAETAGVKPIHEACEKCPNTGWCWGSGACQNTGTPLATPADTSAYVVGDDVITKGLADLYALGNDTKNQHYKIISQKIHRAVHDIRAALTSQGKSDAGSGAKVAKDCGKRESAPT